MKRPDYERIAATYDDLALRRASPEDRIARALGEDRGARLAVLDVGCGTGTWLAAQAAAFGEAVLLHGTDPSGAMLARARGKVGSAALTRGRAERLPFADRAFAWVGSRFAFHHFEDKPAALGELVRVLSAGGTLQVTNIAPEHMEGWWVLRFFPEAQAFTEARFWRAEQIAAALEEIGLATTTLLDRRAESLAPADVLEQAERRDQSHLASLEDAAWQAGLARLRRALAAAPDAPVASEIAIVQLTASRR